MLRDITIKTTYKTYSSDEEITNDFINPCLKECLIYKRSVGFFSSSVFSVISDGIKSLINNNGKMQLITTPKLSEDDINAIKLGEETKELLLNGFEIDFDSEINKLDNDNLMLLAELVSKNLLEIKIVTINGGMYHDKIGIFYDSQGDGVAFVGSSNETLNGLKNNYEKIQTSCSWKNGQDDYFRDNEIEFDEIWNGYNEALTVLNFTEACKRKVIEVVEQKGLSSNSTKNSNSGFKLRDYQEEAIRCWKNNGYNGFFTMATGTGKTFTSIYGIKQLLEKERCIPVICAPYKHLIKQWYDDIIKVFPKAKVIMVSSENVGWDIELKGEIAKNNIKFKRNIIVISTIKSFLSEKFENSLYKYKGKRLLVVDEAHRFKQLSDDISAKYQYKLGLSATPYNGKNYEEAKSLLSFFGGDVFSLSIDKAIDDGHLVKYNYYPIYVNSTLEEEREYDIISKKITTCFNDSGLCINKDKLIMLTGQRLKLIANCSEKIAIIKSIVEKYIENSSNSIVYCGAGSLEEYTSKSYINYIMDILNDINIRTSRFTSNENMIERVKLIDSFNSGQISALVAIKCLDEGINIPSIKNALMLSSNDDYKEFVQRRGRILRKYPNKEYANIYDIVVLPNNEKCSMAKIEMRRVIEYARLADNYKDIEFGIIDKLRHYNLDEESLKININDINEIGETDE